MKVQYVEDKEVIEVVQTPIPKPTPRVTPKRVKKEEFKPNYRALLTLANNYLKGYKKVYERVKEDEFSKTRLKYEEIIKEKGKLEKALWKSIGLRKKK